MYKKIPILLSLIACFLFMQAAWASDSDVDRLKEENVALKDRIQKMEQDLQELKQAMDTEKEAASSNLAAAVENYVNTNAIGPQEISECGFLSPKGFDINFGGFIKADMAYDTHSVNNGNFATWVNRGNIYGDTRDAQFNLTARQTRMWFDIGGPEGDVKTSARIEWDFYGMGAENKNHIQMRHAFFKAEFPCDWELLAGQTFDIISPLCPKTVNYTVQWFQGNPGYRIGQARLTKNFDTGEGNLAAVIGVTRTVGQLVPTYELKDTGADAGFPTTAAALTWTGDTWGDQKTTLTLSGHYGREEYDSGTTRRNTVQSWSFNLGAKLPLWDGAAIAGEYFWGRNLDQYFAGIGQGVNSMLNAIRARGGWINLYWNASPDWSFTLGYGIDKPYGTGDDSLDAGMRRENWVAYGNVFYTITEALKTGFEISALQTKYQGDDYYYKDLRFQLAFIYYF